MKTLIYVAERPGAYPGDPSYTSETWGKVRRGDVLTVPRVGKVKVVDVDSYRKFGKSIQEVFVQRA